MQPSVEAPQGRRRRGTATRVVLWIVGVVAVLVVLAAGFLVVAMEGGVDGFIANRKRAPDPGSRKLVAARSDLGGELNAVLDGIAPAGWQLRESATDDACWKGENNWKRQDGYAHRCAYRTTRFYGVDADLRAELLALEKRLAAEGWHNTFRPIGEVVADYEAEAMRPQRADRAQTDLQQPGSYHRAGHELDIVVGDSGAFWGILDVVQSVRGTSIDDFHRSSDLKSGSAVLQTVTAKHRFVFAIAVQERYFSN